MKPQRLLFLLILSVTLFTVSCKHQKTVASDDKEMSKGGSGGAEGTGDSFSDAIIITETNESDGVSAEYAWLKAHYPGYSTVKQSLVYDGGKPYDLIEIKTAQGEKKKVYFDISNFFGKF